MDPSVSGMYVSDGHSVLWWVGFLCIMVTFTMGLTGVFLLGVTRAYAHADEHAPAPEPIPLDGPVDDPAAALDSPDEASSTKPLAGAGSASR